MQSIQEDMNHFRVELQSGSLQRAYRALLAYMRDLRAHFKKKYPQFAVSGLYQGYLDMSYFALVPPSFKRRGLKIAIVFNYDAFRFEAWLSGANRQVLLKYWKLVKDTLWPEYRLVVPEIWADSIIEYDLVESFDFGDIRSLTVVIEKKVAKFTKDMERFLLRH
jgi:hypothetical protein